MKDRRLSLLDLPSEILESEIDKKLDLITLSRIVCVNKRANQLFQKPFFNAFSKRPPTHYTETKKYATYDFK